MEHPTEPSWSPKRNFKTIKHYISVFKSFISIQFKVINQLELGHAKYYTKSVIFFTKVENTINDLPIFLILKVKSFFLKNI